MANIGPTEILLALLSMLFLAIVAAMFMAWGWLIWRLLTGQPILPERPMVSRRETPGGVGTGLARRPGLPDRKVSVCWYQWSTPWRPRRAKCPPVPTQQGLCSAAKQHRRVADSSQAATASEAKRPSRRSALPAHRPRNDVCVETMVTWQVVLLIIVPLRS